MQRVTITLDDDLMADLDRIIEARGYQNRSRRSAIWRARASSRPRSRWPASATGLPRLVYVYDHHARELPKRLTG